MQWAFGRFPSFVLGMLVADGCKNEKTIHVLWIVLLTAFYVPLHWLFGFDNIEWVVVPFVLYLTTLLAKWLCRRSWLDKSFVFMGKISLESYLMNIALNGLLVLLIPAYFSSTVFYGRYLEYSIVIVLGTLLAYIVNEKSQHMLICSKKR